MASYRTLFGGAVLLLSSISTVGIATAQERGGTLRVGITQMGPTPDPVVTTFGVNWMTAINVCEGLFGLDGSWTPQPVLVDSFDYSEDGKTLTLKLREGLKFHSGAALTASDVVASLERLRSAAGIGASFAGVTEGITAADDLTVRIDLKSRTPIVPGLLSGGQAVIMSASSIEDASSTKAVSDLDCTGPYRLTEYRPDQGVTMTRWADYQPLKTPSSAQSGTKHAYADEIVFRLMPEPSVRRDSLITGELDIAMSLPTDFYERLEADPNTIPVTVANNQSLTAVFNTEKGVMADVNLRRAVYHALKMEPIMLASVGNTEFYSIDGSWIPDPNSFWYTTAGIEEFGQPDPDKVKEYLAASNYKGEKIRWLVATEQYQKHFLTAVTAAQQLRDVGINVEIIEQPIATYLQTRANPDEMDAFSSFLPTYVDPTSIAYLNPTYPGFWTAPRKMELMERLATTIDPGERKKIFEEVHALAYDTFPFIKYGTESNMYGIRSGVQNYSTSSVAGDTFYNVAPPAR